MITLKKNLVDLEKNNVYPVSIVINEGTIISIKEINEKVEGYILPGFIDSHIHIESSMLVPSEFAIHAVKHGTIATISDPHEIANVLGTTGVDYMINNGNQVPFYFFFGAPSCVPATKFETSGAEINAEEIGQLIKRPEILYLAEMMNFPGVIHNDPEVIQKIHYAKQANKPIDGHAPGLTGNDMLNYFKAGISTDHECFNYQEAYDKAKAGVKILIREGSAAKNFDELIPLINHFPEQIMFCSDDKHPDDLMEGHINLLVKRALAKGYNLFDVLRAASINVIKHYQLPVGYLKTGHSADFICVNNLTDFEIEQIYIKGNKVYENGNVLIKRINAPIINNFNCSPKKPENFSIISNNKNNIRIIEALDGQLITNELIDTPTLTNNELTTNINKDLLKITVVNRYSDQAPAVAFIKNFGLKQGAIASCVAHDCHNIVAVGTNDTDLCNAVNAVIKNKGGIAVANKQEILSLALPIAGIMTNAPGEEVSKQYTLLDKKAKELGTKLRAPFMTLSFMALLVIPKLKLSDKGLFNGETFTFTSIQF